MNNYPIDSFDKISALLQSSCRNLGANGFSVGDEVLSLDLAMDDAGPVVWALILHADQLVQQTGISETNSTNTLPFNVIVNPEAPFGNQAIVQTGKLPMSLGYTFLDAALEHCICIGMKHYGYRPEQWDQLEPEEKVIPLEPYIADLKEHWITDLDPSAPISERVQARPLLLDLKTLSSEQPSKSIQSKVLKFPSIQ